MIGWIFIEVYLYGNTLGLGLAGHYLHTLQLIWQAAHPITISSVPTASSLTRYQPAHTINHLSNPLSCHPQLL